MYGNLIRGFGILTIIQMRLDSNKRCLFRVQWTLTKTPLDWRLNALKQKARQIQIWPRMLACPPKQKSAELHVMYSLFLCMVGKCRLEMIGSFHSSPHLLVSTSAKQYRLWKLWRKRLSPALFLNLWSWEKLGKRKLKG